MTSLFRPWTEDGVVPKSEVPGLGSIYADPLTGSEVWSPKREREQELEEEEEEDEEVRAGDVDDRETKYKNVKENVKRRSEKHFRKKSKAKEAKPEVKSVPIRHTWDFHKGFPEASCPTYQTSSCHYPEGFVDPLDFGPADGICLPPPLPLPPPAPTAYPHSQGGSPDLFLLETALAHGSLPNLFEEYARFLTEQQKQVTDRNRKQRPKKFRCPHCQVGFSNNGQLKGHIRIHTGERPFKCDADSCGKSFTRNEELTRHRRIHSGLRPFPCSECGKRFGRKDHLKKHVKTHFQQRYQLVPILPGHCPYLYGL